MTPVAVFLLCFAHVVLSGVPTDDFCYGDMCTYDLIEHCLTNGTIVLGQCALKQAVCDEFQEEDEEWDGFYECRPWDFCLNDICTLDLIPHCMEDGEIVEGCVGLKDAECEFGKREQRFWDMGQNCLPEDFCETDVCTRDYIEYCMTDGTIVNGCNNLKDVICHEGKVENRWWDEQYVCRPWDFCQSDICTLDLIPHCMEDGDIVDGCVGLKYAECQLGKEEQRFWYPDENCLPEDLCETDVCTRDYIEYCMTDGTVVNGCVNLKNAICDDGKVENRYWDDRFVCRPLDLCDSEVCTKDSIRHCMSDGYIAVGCEDRKDAICNYYTEEQRYWIDGTNCLTVGYCGSECPEDGDEEYHCMTDGTLVCGCEELKIALCDDDKEENEDWDPNTECLPIYD